MFLTKRGTRSAALVVLVALSAGCSIGPWASKDGAPAGPGGAGSEGASAPAAGKATPPDPVAIACERPSGKISGEAPALGLVPKPAAVQELSGDPFEFTAQTRIEVDAAAPGLTAPATYLGQLLTPATGWQLQVGDSAEAGPGIVRFCPLGDAAVDAASGKEHYELYASATGGVTIFADGAAAGFDAVATLRQLLPPQVEAAKAADATWQVPSIAIADKPRYRYRAMMIDVARSFYPPEQLKKVIDTLALYKLNVLHLHLSDDQGWRIAVAAYPKLTEIGASYQSGRPEPSGPYFYSQADFKDLVAYAAARGITTIPELDGPSHVNAAQTAYGQLSCDGKTTEPYTGHDVGFSLYCLTGEQNITQVREFLSRVWGEVAALTPGPYVHMGGDEAMKSTPTTFGTYVSMAGQIAQDNGKKMIGWAQIGAASLPEGSVLQYWGTALDNRSIGGAESEHITQVREGLEQGASVVMSPADRTYVDQCYDATTPVGTNWAGCIEPKTAYDWDPALYLSAGTASSAVIPAKSILGIEATLFADHLYRGWPAAGAAKEFMAPIEYFGYMALPRMPALAEVAWSAQDQRTWSDFKSRIAPHDKRWKEAGLTYYDSGQIW